MMTGGKSRLPAAFLPRWLLIALYCCSLATADKDPCDTCKRLVDRFHKGLEETSKKNFGGGNTAWEEKTLSKYETSEIRLVEIIERLCDDSNFECNVMVEEHEEQIEKWWFKMQKKHPDFQKWFCIENLKVCCPPGTFGPDCSACVGGSERPCNGNGFCSGDGTRRGDGTCKCHTEYTGESCLDCADGYYSSERNATHSVCSACHESCKTCDGATSEDCHECRHGWVEKDEGCVDHDECAAEESPCKEDQYCLNTQGSYSCNKCSAGCSGCTGEGPDHCKECASGYTLEDGTCKEINECENSEKVCLGENEECVNTLGSYKCVCADGYEERDGQCVSRPSPDKENTSKVTVTNERDTSKENVTDDEAEHLPEVHEDL
ncbi:protein disulfide isomerase CRELD2 [Gastrophryne carolinensis]